MCVWIKRLYIFVEDTERQIVVVEKEKEEIGKDKAAQSGKGKSTCKALTLLASRETRMIKKKREMRRGQNIGKKRRTNKYLR